MHEDQTVTIRQGDSTTKLAFENGLYPDTVWNHANNSALKDKRKNPNILYPGDQLFIPKIREKQVSGADKAKHSFRRKGVPEKLQICFKDYDGQPMKGESWKLIFGATVLEGTLDGDGFLKCSIPPDARSAKLMIGKDGNIDTTDIYFGTVNPISEISGIKQRLFNMGFYDGPINEDEDDDLDAAITDFRGKNGLDADGGLDDEFRNKLQSVYQS